MAADTLLTLFSFATSSGSSEGGVLRPGVWIVNAILPCIFFGTYSLTGNFAPPVPLPAAAELDQDHVQCATQYSDGVSNDCNDQ